MQNSTFLLKYSFFFILLIALIVRLYGFENPIADWHSWRQADTSSVSRNFVKFGFDLLHPRFDDLSNVPSGKDNPNGYRFVEFPIYNAIHASFFLLSPKLFTFEQWGRIVTIFGSLLSITFLYLIVKKYNGITTAWLTAFFFALLPFNIYYGRVILPDPLMVTAILGGIYFFDRAIEKNFQFSIFNFQFLLAILFTASAFLIKPYALFFTLPMLYLTWSHFGFAFIKKWQLWVFAFFSLLPLVAWRLWMQQYPEGIPVSDWLFNGGNIRFKGAFFYWLFADRISRLILGYWGLPLLCIGILATTKKELFLLGRGAGLYFSFLASALLYLFVIARGNVQHDYYQILIIPTVCLFLALGSMWFLRIGTQYFSKIAVISMVFICISFMFAFGWYNIRDYFNINNPSLIKAGEAVDALTPKDAKVMALYDGDTSFLYQTNRKGWASFQYDLSKMITIGATHLVLVNPKKEDFELAKMYSVVSSTPQYLLIDLVKQK